MLFRPSYCANCGEKIERTDWGLFTSRRFCPICEAEFKGQDLIPRVVVGAGVLMMVLGIGGLVKSNAKLEPAVSRQVQSRQAPELKQQPSPGPSITREGNAIVAPGPAASPAPPVQTEVARTPTKQSPVAAAASEAMYYCGAATKKGTPCTRRVKGNVRCYQHLGMPAMLPPEKLRIG